MELAYEHAIAYVVYDGYVSKVLMKELTVLKPGELEKWKEVWEEVKFLPTGLWTSQRSAAFGKVDASVEGNAGEKTEMEGTEGKADEKTEMAAHALAASACALWCFVETGASLLGAVGEGKAGGDGRRCGGGEGRDIQEGDARGDRLSTQSGGSRGGGCPLRCAIAAAPRSGQGLRGGS
ncbi:unnamed protein product [Closterium sp. NIES-65]|nr:unnamed protein product [Closterium sp. NIES-65]